MNRGRTAEIRAQTQQKSSLILQGRLAKETGRDDEAARLFAQAAVLEEMLADTYVLQGLPEQGQRHRFSAVGCWSQAGNFLRALEICDALTQETSSPTALQKQAAFYASLLRERRHRLWFEVEQAAFALAGVP